MFEGFFLEKNWHVNFIFRPWMMIFVASGKLSEYTILFLPIISNLGIWWIIQIFESLFQNFLRNP